MERAGSQNRCDDGTHRSNNTHGDTGSIYSVGRNLQPFRINKLEMVAQICPRWNRTTDWLKGLDEFRIAA